MASLGFQRSQNVPCLLKSFATTTILLVAIIQHFQGVQSFVVPGVSHTSFYTANFKQISSAVSFDRDISLLKKRKDNVATTSEDVTGEEISKSFNGATEEMAKVEKTTGVVEGTPVSEPDAFNGSFDLHKIGALSKNHSNGAAKNGVSVDQDEPELTEQELLDIEMMKKAVDLAKPRCV